ncbi:MAG: carboxyl transferase domain-containing protein [Pseudomonadota bacterium]
MAIFQSSISTSSDSFAKNKAAAEAALDNVRAIEGRVRALSAAKQASFEKKGQRLPRDRVAMILDPRTPFLEFSPLAGYGMHDDDGKEDVFGGGIITGIGVVSGVQCVINASDSAIKGGTISPMGLQKTLRAQTIALEQKLPLIDMVESGGANLAYQSEVYIPGGQSFRNMARLSAAGIPHITIVHGSSTAGGAYVPGLSDYVIMVRDRARVFLAGPPLLKAATGEIATDEELGGAEMHCDVSGVSEYIAENDDDAIRLARDLMAMSGWRDGQACGDSSSYPEPKYAPEELAGVTPPDYRTPYDCREVMARIVDASDLIEFKARWGADTVCTHAHIGGNAVGILGNNGPITPEGAAKAAQFIQACCQTDTPLVFLQNTTGFMVGVDVERSGIVKHGSKMIQAMANAHVPRITINIGASFGAGNYAMCGRAYDPSFLFAWPNAKMAVMGPEQAGKVLRIVSEAKAARAGKPADEQKLDAMEKAVSDGVRAQTGALFATARLWDDGIIDPADTRRILIYTLSIVKSARVRNVFPSSFGVGRM